MITALPFRIWSTVCDPIVLFLFCIRYNIGQGPGEWRSNLFDTLSIKLTKDFYNLLHNQIFLLLGSQWGRGWGWGWGWGRVGLWRVMSFLVTRLGL